MTRPGHHPIGQQVERKVARLMQLHMETHPRRIARRLGVSPAYLKQFRSKYDQSQMAPLDEAIELLNSSAPPRPRSDAHDAQLQSG